MLKEKQNELKNKKQGNMTVTDAVLKFNQLPHLCPNMAPNEEERVRRMLEMFRPELTEIIDTGETPPKTVANCVDRALRAEYYLAKVKRKELNSLKLENMTGAKTRITPIIQVNGRIKATIRHGKVTNGRVTLMDLITRRSNEGTINGVGIPRSFLNLRSVENCTLVLANKGQINVIIVVVKVTLRKIVLVSGIKKPANSDKATRPTAP